MNNALIRLCARIFIISCCLIQPAFAAPYKIDHTHSFVQFKAPHLGVSLLVGRFNSLSGNFEWDKNNPSQSKIMIQVDVTSIDTNHALRNKHLRAEKYLNVAKYPKASFTSTSYEGTESEGTLKGNLNLMGKILKIEIPVQRYGEATDPWGGYRVGFTGTVTIKRSELGLTHHLTEATDPVILEIFIEGIKQ